MIDMRLLIAAVAAMLMLAGVGVIRHQAKATSCPRHSRLVGRIAIAVGWASFLVGIVLMGYTLLLYRG
jgi:hypothetical protein